MTTCQACGAENDPQSEFCAQCDEFIGWAQDAGQASADAVPGPGEPPVDARTVGAPPTEPAGTIEPATPADTTPPEPVDTTPSAEPADPTPPVAAVDTTQPTTPAGTGPQPPIELPTAASAVLQTIDAGSRLAEAAERPDLTEVLHRTRARLVSANATVVLLGEFKRGKSTLINALLQTAVCPVDADIVTSVPTLIGYADSLNATAYALDDQAGDRVARPVSLSEVRAIVAAPEGPPGGEQSVEIGLPHRLLRSGLRLVDTPGVGGLESIHGQLALGMLSIADGVVFVTDAAQELTEPELDYLRTVVEHCPRVIVVVTKTDLHAHWRRIVDLDREHLREAGLDLAVVPVSSFLRLRAATDPDLNAESGFADLVSALAVHIVRPATQRAAALAADEVDYVAGQLAEQNGAELEVIQQGRAPEGVIDRLRRGQQKAAGLSAATSSWQQTLSDGIQDLAADVKHHLEVGMRDVLRNAESVIDESDPRDTWPQTEGWLRARVAKAVIDNRTLLLQRADELAADVAARFELDSGQGFKVPLGNVDDVPSNLPEIDALTTARSGRLAFALVATRSTLYVPMVVFGLLSGIGLAPIGAVVAVGLGLGIGRKALRDEASRQLTNRRQQARGVARSYVEGVAFVLRKDTMDALRTAERGLRDEFQERARAIHTSSVLALRAVERTATMPAEQQSSHARTLSEARERIDHVRQTAERIRAASDRPEVRRAG